MLRPYTSGTTGRPKAVLRAVGSAEASILGMVRYYESYGIAGPDEVNLTASPLHHLAGFSGPHSALIVGHTTRAARPLRRGRGAPRASRPSASRTGSARRCTSTG